MGAHTGIMHATGTALTASQLYALLRLRVDVFVVEQQCPYPELDGVDLLPTTWHFWAAEGEQALGCLRVLTGPGEVARIGRVCTAVSVRGSGLGAELMSAAIAHIGDAESVLDAQTYAAAFYQRFGYVIAGEPYLEDGIEHVLMRRAGRSGNPRAPVPRS